MIIQGTNIPIIFTFLDDMSDIQDIEISLYIETRELKHWSMCNVIIDNEIIIAPLTQAESILFPAGKCFIEVKWMDRDGKVNFARNLTNTIVERHDKTVMEGEAYPYPPISGDDNNENVPNNSGCGCCNRGGVGINTNVMYKINSMSETLIRKGYSPYVDEETGTWWEYDDKLKTFVDTHILAGAIPIPLDDILAYWEASIQEEE